jgi:hypothetical protein
LLYNEGWMLRLVMDWFSANDVPDHRLSFVPGARWYSEALLPSAFLARYQGDPLAGSWAHADGAIGQFAVGKERKADLSLLPDAQHLVVLEAKLFSRLSSGVANAEYFDQAARNVACVAGVLRRAERHPSNLSHLGFSSTLNFMRVSRLAWLPRARALARLRRQWPLVRPRGSVTDSYVRFRRA